MTTLVKVHKILQQFDYQHIVLRTDGRNIIIATVEDIVVDLCDQLDQLHGVTCHEYTLRGPDSLAVVLLTIRIDQSLFHRST